MREHSGAEGKNNNLDPTLKEHERANGVSGEAIQGEKKKNEEPASGSTRRKSP